MPNRILKESICTSLEINNLTPEEERFFYRLIVVCDDFGRMDARPQVLRARCFPLKLNEVTDQDIEHLLKALEHQNLIAIYEADNKPYLQIVTWGKHQRKRAKYSKYPAPSHMLSNDSHVLSSDSHVTANCGHMTSNDRHMLLEKRSTRNEVREAVPSATDSQMTSSDRQMTSNDSQELQKIIDKFTKYIYSGVTPYDIDRLTAYLDDGLEPDLIIYAIEEAAANNARRMSYIARILDRLRDAGIKTRKAAEAEKEAGKKTRKQENGEVAVPYHRIVRVPRGDAVSPPDAGSAVLPDKPSPRREDADSSRDAVSLGNADFPPGQRLAEAWRLDK